MVPKTEEEARIKLEKIFSKSFKCTKREKEIIALKVLSKLWLYQIDGTKDGGYKAATRLIDILESKGILK